MKVQFMSDDNKIIYCDDEILRITYKDNIKEYKVSEVGKVEVERNIIYFYDINGNCFDSSNINEKEHISKIDKMKKAINTKKIKINEDDRNRIENIHKDKITIKKFFYVIVVSIVAIIVFSFLNSTLVKKEHLDRKIESVATEYLYKNSFYENYTYSVELESTNNDGAIYFIYDCLRSLKEYKNIKKVKNIILTAVNKERKLYEIQVSGEQIYNWDLDKLINYEPKQIISLLSIKSINPFIVKWVKIAEFKGSSIQRTANFTIKSDNARIKWNTWSDKDYGDFNFICFMYFKNGDIADPYGIANVIGNNKGESYIRKAGTYYFDINTAQGYNIVVEEEIQE